MAIFQVSDQSLAQMFFQHASNGIALVTLEGEIADANPVLCKMLGYSRPELLRMHFNDLLGAEDRIGDFQPFAEGASQLPDRDFRLNRRGGQWAWASLNAELIGTDNGSSAPYLMLEMIDASRRKETETKLDRVNKLYRLLSENIRDAVYQCRADGRVIYCSPSLLQLLGYEEEEMEGLAEETLFIPDDIRKLKKATEGSVTQLRMRHHNGKAVWVEIVTGCVPGEDSPYIQRIAKEITDRKKNEQMMAESLLIARMGSWEWDVQTEEVFFSDQLHQICAIDVSEWQDRAPVLLDMVPADIRPVFRETVESALNGHGLDFEFRQEHEDGTFKYMHVRGLVSFTPEGNPVKLTGTVQDMTERKKTELKLQETVERYTSLKKYNHDAVFSLDLEGNIIHSNAKAEELTGFPIHEMTGRNFSYYIGNGNIKEILADSKNDVNAEKDIDQIRHRNGRKADVLTTIAPIIINKENVGYYIIAKDITEQKKLMIAKEAAESTNRAKSEFLAMMSHEIRTPMNGVIGMTDLLLETTDIDSSQREYLEVIKKSGETLLVIINDILDFSKIDSGRTELVEEAFDVRNSIFETVDTLSAKAQEKKLDISFSMGPDVPAVLIGDSTRLKQVLLNLIGNSVKFTSSGGVCLMVRLQARHDGEVMLKFTVKDTGIGIPEEKTEQLFQPFYQLDNFMTRRSEGTGLGLAISKKLVNLMGGDIWVVHTGEPGSTFVFTVILREKDKPGMSPQDKLQAGDKQGPQRPLQILVAEDNRINQLVLIKILENQGHSVTIAENGNEVMEKALTEKYDLIFMDIYMPGINGLEATAMIKDALKPEQCPVIVAVTANALKGDREKCLASGMDEYISKPISRQVVHDMVRKFFTCI